MRSPPSERNVLWASGGTPFRRFPFPHSLLFSAIKCSKYSRCMDSDASAEYDGHMAATILDHSVKGLSDRLHIPVHIALKSQAEELNL